MNHENDTYISVSRLRRQLDQGVSLSDYIDDFLAKTSNTKEHLGTACHLKAAPAIGCTSGQNVGQLEDPEYLKRVKSKLSKMARHKAWRKRRTEKRRQEREAERKKQNERLDQLERRRIEAIRDIEQRKQQQIQDTQVRVEKQLQDRRKNRIRDLSRLLNRLTVLRDLRRKKLEAKGHFFADEGNAFYNKIKAWNDILASSDETVASPPAQDDDSAVIVDPQDQWENAPLDIRAYRYWCQGLQTTGALRGMRKQWDRFIVKEEGDSLGVQDKVPPTFIDPPPPSGFWESYLVKDND